jgi:hypothetical protein
MRMSSRCVNYDYILSALKRETLRDISPSYNRFSVYTSAVKMPTIANEKTSFEVKFVQIYFSAHDTL